MRSRHFVKFKTKPHELISTRDVDTGEEFRGYKSPLHFFLALYFYFILALDILIVIIY